jgi:hypothetical protein
LDDTIEVRPVKRANSGRDAFPTLVRRQKLPKNMSGLEDLATTTPIGANHDIADKKDRFITWRDIRIGSFINVLGRPFYVYAVDKFTSRFYLERRLRTDQELAAVPPPVATVRHTTTVPHRANRHADEGPMVEDDEFFKPQPRRPNIFRMLQNEGKVLRFAARLEDEDGQLPAFDADRRFIVAYRLTDDIMVIYELANKKAGTQHGKFMERGTPVNPQTGSFYEPQDLFIDARIKVKKSYHLFPKLVLNSLGPWAILPFDRCG